MTAPADGSAVPQYLAQTSDIDEAAASLSTIYRTTVTVDAAPSPAFSYDASTVGDAALSLGRLRFGSSARSGAAEFDDFIVCHVLEGRHRWRLGRESGVGTIPFLVTPGKEMAVEFDRLDLVTVSVTAEALHRTMDSIGRSSRNLMLDRPNSISRSPRLMAATLRYLDIALRQDPAVFASPLVRAEALRQAVVAIAETYGEPVEELPETSLVRPRAIRRALAFMDSNAHLPVTVADVARESGLSLRGLQSAFRKQMGMSPSEYLRRIRLHAARDELLHAPDAGAVTVESVAQRWGFAHAGRFAAHYRSTFGERPSETLRS